MSKSTALLTKTIAFQQGIIFWMAGCKPAQLQIHTTSPEHSTASVTISEGKFHQVKKMFLAVGVKVTYLKRTHLGDFQLDPNITEGSYRPLNPSELEIIKGYLEQQTPGKEKLFIQALLLFTT